MKFPTKIPTILGLLLVVGMMGSVVFVSERLLRNPTTASGSAKPANVQTSNITDTGLTVTWTTSTPATGAIEVKPAAGKKTVAFDDRDAAIKKQSKYTTHSATVRNISPSTSYEITILSNGKAYRDNGKPYSITTAPAIPPQADGLEPAFGTVLTSDNKPADGALVILSLEGSQMLSTVVKPSGSWVIPLNLLRTADLSRFVVPTERMTETIIVRDDGKETSATSDTLNDSPVPEMILGKTYDFRKQQAEVPLPAEALAEAGSPIALISPIPPTPAVLGAETTPASFAVTLTAPAEGASLATTLPLVQGTGFPGKFVAITLGITNPVSGSTTVGADGLWRFTPAKALAPGKQSVTITTQDDKAKDIALTHTFEILKSGTQVLGVATPSATLAPTFTPTPTSTMAGEPVPTSGSILPTLLLLMAGLLLVSGGFVALAL
ncbi:hypothetical protein A3A64_01790 [Candidatus Gottesmanbacteria bacterium RIFCSPLOWO2_01_FULL_48_11]|uniref:Fibronectin type-III domain-containing protein n=1 Tax=Candidatus Gottesmanbacteria bacterium RIFCSPLOWO2_01_FULL_48_11 TaxID=1798395 RepID=A0A1F6AS65_9BACT|nr:MAG: hypothetical protein A3A64_01790 [Candidatus Gottesmanbacteria bacterium RIFCSPLOWO2_01_FULL_48_11]